MNHNDKEFAEIALGALKKATGIEGKWIHLLDKGIDGKVDLTFQDNKKLGFYVEVKKELRNHHMPRLMDQGKRWAPLMVIAENLFPKIKKALRDANIAYLETNGNTYLRQRPSYLIWIDTNGIVEPVRKPAKGLTKTGLKVAFLLLTQEAFLNRTYREISEAAGVALGGVNQAFQTLKEFRHLMHKNKNEYVLTEKKTLLERWLVGYEEKLKPTLHIGNFTFANRHDYVNWKNLQIDQNTTQWGGEPAGDLLTNYLNPETLTLYTTENAADLIKKFRIIPDEHGKLRIYRRFWKVAERNANTVPTLLTYTDLINTGNPRCTETAIKIYDEYLRNQFQ